MLLALRSALFLYRMDIRVGQCVSQASQRQSLSAKLFRFIASPPFPLFLAHPPKPPNSHTFHIIHIYWPCDHLSYDTQLKFPSSSLTGPSPL